MRRSMAGGFTLPLKLLRRKGEGAAHAAFHHVSSAVEAERRLDLPVEAVEVVEASAGGPLSSTVRVK